MPDPNSGPPVTAEEGGAPAPDPEPAPTPDPTSDFPAEPPLASEAETRPEDASSLSPSLEDDMAFPTAVNNQITDAVTQSNVSVVGAAPAQAMGGLYLSSAHSLGLAATNATVAQQQGYILAQAATTRCVLALLGGKEV